MVKVVRTTHTQLIELQIDAVILEGNLVSSEISTIYYPWQCILLAISHRKIQ